MDYFACRLHFAKDFPYNTYMKVIAVDGVLVDSCLVLPYSTVFAFVPRTVSLYFMPKDGRKGLGLLRMQ